MNGFTGRSGLLRCPGAAPGAAGARGGGAARGAGAADGGAGRMAGAVGGAAGAGTARGAGGGAGRAGAAGGAGADVGAAIGPEKRGMAGARGGAGAGAGGAGAGGGAGGWGAAMGPAGAAGARWAAATWGGPVSATGARCAAADELFTANTLLHTAQRARTPPAGTLDGSTRYTVSHDGQVTFISRPAPRPHRAPDHAGGRPRTPSPAGSSRSSSSPSRARSPERDARSGGAGWSRSRWTGSSVARDAAALADPSRSSTRRAGPARCTGTESACRTRRVPRRTRRESHRTGCL